MGRTDILLQAHIKICDGDEGNFDGSFVGDGALVEHERIVPTAIGSKATTAVTTPPTKLKRNMHLYELIGRGTFGVVYRGYITCKDLVDDSEDDLRKEVAIKRVKIDRRYVDRELPIMLELTNTPCRYVISLEGYDVLEDYVYMAMELFPFTLYEKIPFTLELTRVLVYQLLRAVEHVHALNIMHRDIKPTNILYNPEARHVVLTDFGTAKHYDSNVTSTSYICSRYYRAPECILENRNYTMAIDVWSVGCCLGEMLSGRVMFLGRDNADQLYLIFRQLGFPTPSDLLDINPELDRTVVRYCLLQSNRPRSFRFGVQMPRSLKSLLWSLLRTNPKKRSPAGLAANHVFFNV